MKRRELLTSCECFCCTVTHNSLTLENMVFFSAIGTAFRRYELLLLYRLFVIRSMFVETISFIQGKYIFY